MIKSAWNAAVNWFERGDLIPLLVLVSAVHYANILSAYDYWAVAVAIGLLVDLGHYRVIRAAVRYNGVNVWESLARWVIAAVMTAVSLSYHQRFYSDWWLSIPLPLLIAALAWLQRVDGRNVTKPIEKVTKVIEPIETPIEKLSKPIDTGYEVTKSNGIAYGNIEWIGKPTCTICGYVAKNQNALNSHKRIHKLCF